MFPNNICPQNNREEIQIWTEYVKEAEEFDSHLLDTWNRTTDVMLVFVSRAVSNYLRDFEQ